MRFCWLLLALTPFLYSVEAEEEGLFLRRIADFWQEGEYQIAKNQMERFIVEYPQSPFSDALCAALGDLFLREKNFSNALNYYTQVQAPEFYNRVFLKRMQCLYEMGWYATLADQCEEFLKKGPDLNVTYFLAIGLYHQCINSSKDTEHPQQIATRAKPYFEIIYQSELREEVAQGYAHLSCILKDYERATEIYKDLAMRDPSHKEEMLFQVALIQSEYNKELAVQTFDEIVQLGQKRCKEANYNRIVLAFDLGRFDELAKEELLKNVPDDKVGATRLFLGRSLSNLKQYEEAISQLKAYIVDAPVSETLYAALISLLDATFQSGDLRSLDETILKLKESYPEDAQLPKAYFSRSQLLKRLEETSAAKEQLEVLLAEFPDFEQISQVLFELTHLSYKEKNWEDCYAIGQQFLSQFSSHELAPYAWRYFVCSSLEVAPTNAEHHPQLAKDIEAFLTLDLALSERNEWELMLAKTYFEMQQYSKAIECLREHDSPNAKMLLALCHRDAENDIEKFCSLAEEALLGGANLVDPGQIHASLYNAYLALSQVEKSAEHLLIAFAHKTEIKVENLLWLGDHYFRKLLQDEGNFVLAGRTASLLEKCISIKKDQKNEAEALEPFEPIVCMLAKVYGILGRIDDEVALLESLEAKGDESKLLLAECYVKKGLADQAKSLFDEIVCSAASLRTPIGASASLQAAKLKLSFESPDLIEIAKQLKDLVIQKNIYGEPAYLEAALEYIDLRGKDNIEKKLSLLIKTKQDFERTDDLLSKDYHAGRLQCPEKNAMYENYMLFIDANIAAVQSALHPENKDLRAKSEDLLLKIAKKPIAKNFLKPRVDKLLADET